MSPGATAGLGPRINVTPFTTRAVASGVRLNVVPDTVISVVPGTSGVPSTAYPAESVPFSSAPDNKMRVWSSTVRVVALGARLHVTPEIIIGSAPGINCTPFTARAVASVDRLYVVPDTVIGFAPGISGLASKKINDERVSRSPDTVSVSLLANRAVPRRARQYVIPNVMMGFAPWNYVITLTKRVMALFALEDRVGLSKSDSDAGSF